MTIVKGWMGIDSRFPVWVLYSRFASADLTASCAEAGGRYLRGKDGVSQVSPIGRSSLSHKSDVVVIAHLHRRCEQRVSLAEDGPHYAHSLTFHDVGWRLETKMKIPEYQNR